MNEWPSRKALYDLLTVARQTGEAVTIIAPDRCWRDGAEGGVCGRPAESLVGLCAEHAAELRYELYERPKVTADPGVTFTL